MMDYRLLRAKMAASGETQKELADAVGIALSTLNAKLNRNGTDFTLSDIRKIKAHYNLSAEEVDQIFFGTKVS